MSASPFINEFNRVIRGLDAPSVDSLRHRERSCIQTLVACKNNSRISAKTAIEPYEKRQITEDAEWVYDDFLLFSFLCCFVKFGESSQLIGELVSLRRRSEQGERLSFLQDVERLIQAESFSAQSMFTVVIADFLEKEVDDALVLRSAHREAVKKQHDAHMNALEATIATRCQEVVAELSISSSMSSSIIARNLWKRSRIAAMIIYLSITTSATCMVAWGIWLNLFGENEVSSLTGKFLSFGAIGVVIYLWKIKEKCYERIAYSLLWIAAGKSGHRAMRSFNQNSQSV